MNALFKKYFWSVHLLSIALIAWMLAAGVSEYIGGMLFSVPQASAKDAASGSYTRTLTAGRVNAMDEAAVDLEARRIFDLRPPPALPGEGDNGDANADAQSDANSGDDPQEEAADEIPESNLPIDLVGTIASDDDESSMATLKIDGNVKLAWIGSQFMEGKAEIIRIEPRHIVVKESEGLKLIKLWDDKKSGAKDKRGAKADRRGAKEKVGRGRETKKPEAAKRPGRKDYSQGVKKTGAYDYEIDRAMLDEQLQDLTALGTQARIVPNYRSGKYEGFKLEGVRPGSLYRAIGIRSGDVIKTINGKPIDSPNKAIELFDRLKASSNIALEIERRGQPKELNYTIK